MKKCACCDEPLNSEGECINECTDDPRYGVAEGYNMDEVDHFMMYKECENCGEKFTNEEVHENSETSSTGITFTCPKCEWEIYLKELPPLEE